MKKHSCGAILYTILNNKVYIILGLEKGKWYPFKGTREKGETNEMAAIREIYEETCGVITLNKIELDCNFSTKRKYYHIGLLYIPSGFIDRFYNNRRLLLNNINTIDKKYKVFLEKNDIKMFSLNEVNYRRFHHVTSIPIKYYYDKLKKIERDQILKKTNSPYTQSTNVSFSGPILL